MCRARDAVLPAECALKAAPTPEYDYLQSGSSVRVAPFGQQPSSGVKDVIGKWLQRTLQLVVLPVWTSCVHASPSSQLRGHAAPPRGSHVSVVPGSTMPSPQRDEQSLSPPCMQLAGQQPSSERHSLMLAIRQLTLQLLAAPMVVTCRHLSSDLHTGQDSGGSHVSPISTMLLPHLAWQSASARGSTPIGQQPSPSRGLVIACGSQRTSHALPVSKPISHGLGFGHVVGHAPAVPRAIAVSQRSLPLTMPSPQRA